MKVEIFKSLLAKFQEVPKSELSEPTFMEITSYPHLEIVSSNVLAFYLDPSREHQLNEMMLTALLSSIGRLVDEGDVANATVTTEATTASNKRLDLLIETDSFVIGIENKIYHSLHNDLNDYYQHLTSRAGKREVIPLLLTLNPIKETSELGKFKPITYEVLFENVRKYLGHFLVSANHRYVMYLIDFMTTIENLLKGTKMNQEFINFVAINEQEVMLLFNEVAKLRNEISQKISSLKESLRVTSEIAGFAIHQYHYSDSIRMRSILGNTLIDLERFPITVMAIIDLSGWQIELKIEDKYGGRTFLKEWLDDKGIATTVNPDDPNHFIYSKGFAYNESLEVIHQEVLKAIELIKSNI